MKKLLTLSAAALWLSACVSSSDMERLEIQIGDLQDQVAELKKSASSKDEVDKLNSTLATQTSTILRSSADVAAKVGELDDKIQNTHGLAEQAHHRLDTIVTQLSKQQRELDEIRRTAAAARPPVAGAEPSADEVTVQAPHDTGDPLEMYQSAYRDYQRGNYDLAIDGFRDFLATNASSDLADNAAYWIGESLFSQKKYREAVAQFDKVVNGFPRSDKVPASLLKKGYSHIELGEKAQGVVQLQYVVHEHPRSPEASLAREKLRALGIETK